MHNLRLIVNRVFSSITYIVPCPSKAKECWIVDCGDVEKIIDWGYTIHGVLLTHVHYDHIYGLPTLLEAFPQAAIYTNADGFQALQDPRRNFSRYHFDVPDFMLENIDAVKIIDVEGDIELSAGLKARALFTPGHTPNCLSYIIEDNLFTGDAYIPGIKVVTSFPHSDKNEAAQSIKRLVLLEQRGLNIRAGHVVSRHNSTLGATES